MLGKVSLARLVMPLPKALVVPVSRPKPYMAARDSPPPIALGIDRLNAVSGAKPVAVPAAVPEIKGVIPPTRPPPRAVEPNA